MEDCSGGRDIWGIEGNVEGGGKDVGGGRVEGWMEEGWFGERIWMGERMENLVWRVGWLGDGWRCGWEGVEVKMWEGVGWRGGWKSGDLEKGCGWERGLRTAVWK